MDNKLLPLLQLCDSNFPIGAFSHSFGVETYIQQGKVVDKHTFAEWLKVYIREQLVHTDGLAVRLTYEALLKGDWEKVWTLDRLITVQSFARESREGNSRMGQRMIQLSLELYDLPELAVYRDKVSTNRCFGHPAIAFAIIAHGLGISQQTAILSFLFSCTTSLVQNGVRGIPLGQTEGQRLIQELQSHLMQALNNIEALDEDDFAVTSPGIELSQMKHEQLHIRLFMS